MKRLGLVFLMVLMPFASVAQALDEEEVKRLALEAILENPDIIMEAVAIIREREAAAEAESRDLVLSQQRELLEQDPNAPTIGSADSSAVIVEFFDYNCPYCQRAAADVKALMATDSDIRVVYREWPILGDGSVFAARAALASQKQGQYEAFHFALMEAKGRKTEASVLRIAKDVGLDLDKLTEDMKAPEVDAHIETTMELAQALGFNGTPAFVIGDALVPGAVSVDQLKELVAEARE